MVVPGTACMPGWSYFSRLHRVGNEQSCVRSVNNQEFQENEHIPLCCYSTGCRKTCALMLLDWEVWALALDFSLCAGTVPSSAICRMKSTTAFSSKGVRYR